MAPRGQGSYSLKTKNGYDLFEASSAIQKSIRRGDEETAMFFVTELWMSGYDEYAWKRLKIMSSEDVGLAEPNISANIHALYQMYLEQTKKTDGKHNPERLFLTHAVLMLCRAKKSRLVDWTLVKNWRAHEAELLAIPDYALDKHTQRGRRMGRGFKHFFEEGSKLENHVDLPGEKEARAAAGKIMKKLEGSDTSDAVQDDMFEK